MPATIQDLVIGSLLIALYILGYTVYRAYNNGETSSQIMNRLKEHLYLIISYFAIFFIVYYNFTTMKITVPNELNTEFEFNTTGQALQTCDHCLWTCNHSLGLAAQRNELLEKRATIHIEHIAAARRRLSECEAEISGLMEGRSKDWWAFLEGHEDPVWKAKVMAGMSEQMRNDIWVVGREKKRERDGEKRIKQIEV